MPRLLARLTHLGQHVNPWLALMTVVLLSAAWQVTLTAFDTHFRSISGLPLLDLQNDLRPGELMTTSTALSQIQTYTVEARSTYWTFFVLDCLAPPVVFGAYAILWASLLARCRTPFAERALRRGVLLLPLGVGPFDWGENLGYVAAMHAASTSAQVTWLDLGLTFKWLKAACVIPTTSLTVPLVLYTLWIVARRRGTGSHTSASGRPG